MIDVRRSRPGCDRAARGTERRQCSRGGRRHADRCVHNAFEAVCLSISEQLDVRVRRHGLSYSRVAACRDIPEPSSAAGPSVYLPALETAKLALYRAMRTGRIAKADLARRLHWHAPQVDRVIDVHHGSKLDQLEAALAAVGKRLIVDVADLEPLPIAVRRTVRGGARGLRAEASRARASASGAKRRGSMARKSTTRSGARKTARKR
jgi:hypothetical protein